MLGNFFLSMNYREKNTRGKACTRQAFLDSRLRTARISGFDILDFMIVSFIHFFSDLFLWYLIQWNSVETSPLSEFFNYFFCR